MKIPSPIRTAFSFFRARQSKILDAKNLAKRMERDIQHGASSHAAFAFLHISLSRSDNFEAMLGDENCQHVTQELLRRIRSILRKQDYFAFPAPDAIWVCLPQLSSPTVARLAASNLISFLEAPITNAAATVTIRPVIGIAVAERQDITALHMFKTAANAETRARALSQRYWTEVTNSTFGFSNSDLVKAVQYALLHNEFTVVYQPKILLHSKQVVGIETLVRWESGSQPSMLGPAALIEIAEQNGMIQDMTRFILNAALREYVESLAGLGLGKLWVNLSASMLRDANLASWLLQIVEVWGVRPDQVGFEVTEGTLLTDVEQSISTLHALADCGFNLAIDDFGTGYSSLFYLRRFPVSELKIDKLFVQHMSNSVPDRQIVRAIIDLAHNFQLEVVAEGAEDEVALALLAEMGCDQVQGYVFAQPMTVEELRHWKQSFPSADLNCTSLISC